MSTAEPLTSPLGDDDVRIQARSMALLHLSGCLLALAWLAASDPPLTEWTVIAAVVGLGLVSTGVMLVRGSRLPAAAIPWIGAFAMALTAGGVGASGGWRSPFGLFFMWGIAWAFAFLPTRIALAETAWIAVCYLTASLLSGTHPGDDVSTWLIRFGTVVVLGVLLATTADGARRRARALQLAEARGRRRAVRQAQVAEIGVRAVAGEGLEALLASAVEAAARGLGTPLAWVQEHQPVAHAFTVRTAYGFAADALTEEEAIDGRPTLGGATLDRDELLWPEGDPPFALSPALAGLGLRAAAAVPLRGRARRFGILAVGSEEPCRFDYDDLNFLRSLANLIAGAIDRRSNEEAIRHRALHDPLTGLPNRTLLLDRLALALHRGARHHGGVAVLFIDLDGFKRVNDVLGHRAGDELLVALAPRLRRALRASDTVARLGGDEFAVLVEDADSIDEAAEVADRLAAAVGEPVPLGDKEARVTASIGIALGRGGEADAEGLLRDADVALYRAKERGRGRWEVFDEALRARTVARRRVEEELGRALEQDELRLAYEPVVHLATGELVGAEALVRWAHPGRGLLPPADFVAIAEATGLILPLGRWVLGRACRQAASWGGDGEAPWVAVNLAARQVTTPGLVDEVRSVLDESGLPPERLRLEITESALLEEAANPAATLAELRALGVLIVLDDFGTGYSSLGYVHRLPIDSLKIDRSFVARLDEAGDGDGERPIVEAIVSLAGALGLEVIAEGIERPAQADELIGLGCHLGQGYALTRGPSARELAALTARRG